jgi:hypothetical protein
MELDKFTNIIIQEIEGTQEKLEKSSASGNAGWIYEQNLCGYVNGLEKALKIHMELRRGRRTK